MPGARRPTDDDRRQAIRIALGGLATGRDIFDVGDDLAVFHPKNNTFPAEVLLSLAADALAEAAPTRSNPIPYEGIRERYLPEREFSGRNEHHKSHYALTATAMIHAGVAPDILGEVTWWRTDDLWLFSLYALVVYARIAAERTGLPMGQLCDRIAQRHGVSLADAPNGAPWLR